MKFPNMKYYGGPDQEETDEVTLKMCMACGYDSPEFSMKFYKEIGHVCEVCRPQVDKDIAEQEEIDALEIKRS